MAWIYLFGAGLLEIAWAYSMKKSDGFTQFTPTLIMLVTMAASFCLLTLSLKTLPLGTAYTVWMGIGAVGVFAVGIMALGESAAPMRILAAALVVAGLVLLRFSSPE